MENINEIVVNRLYKDVTIFDIEPLDLRRSWMDDTIDNFAYKCLPLKIANRYGWVVNSPVDFSVSWYGGIEPINVEVMSDDPKFDNERIITHFGSGTFTIELDFILKTPEGFSTYLRGVPNKTYSLLKPLDAIVETDWLPFPFTYNFMFTEPGTIEFKKGDPLFTFFPVERGTVENFKIRSAFIEEEDAEFFKDFKAYHNSRLQTREGKDWYQKYYLRGEGPNKKFNIKNHITKLFFGTIDK